MKEGNVGELQQQLLVRRFRLSLNVYFVLEALWGCTSGIYVSLVAITIGLVEAKVLTVILILGISMLIQAILEFPLGYLADRIGKTLIIKMAYLFRASSLGIYALVAFKGNMIAKTALDKNILESGVLLYVAIAEILFGAAAALRSGALDAWIINQRRRVNPSGKDDAMFARAGYLFYSGMAGFGALALLLAPSSPALPWVFGCAVSIIALGFSIGFVKPGRAMLQTGLTSDSDSQVEEKTEASIREILRYLKSRTAVKLVLIGFTCCYLGWWFVGYLYTGVISREVEIVKSWSWLPAVTWLLVSIARVCTNSLTIRLANRGVSRRARLLFGVLSNSFAILVASSMLIFLSGQSSVIMFIVLPLMIIAARAGQELTDPTLSGLLNTTIDRDDIRASLLSLEGLLTSASVFLMTIVPFVLGFNTKNLPNVLVGYSWLLVGLIVVIGILPLLRVFKLPGGEHYL